MVFSSFLSYLVGTYIVYYGGNITYDLMKSPERKTAGDSEEEFKISDIHINENYVPEDVSMLYSTDRKEEVPLEENLISEPITEKETPSNPTPEEDLPSILDSHEEQRKKLFNVTNHGGYSTIGLRSIFTDVLNDGENPFQSIAEKL